MGKRLKKVLFIEGYTPDPGLPESVWKLFKAGAIELWNAPRSLVGHGRYQGEFLHGVFYVHIDSTLIDAASLRIGLHRQNAWPLEYVTEQTVRDYFHAKAVEYEIAQEEEDGFDFIDMALTYANHRNHDDD